MHPKALVLPSEGQTHPSIPEESQGLLVLFSHLGM